MTMTRVLPWVVSMCVLGCEGSPEPAAMSSGSSGTDSGATSDETSSSGAPAEGSETTGTDSGATSTGLDPDTGSSSTGEPPPPAECPAVVDGVVTFCPSTIETCREVLVVGADAATGQGPLVVYWHGTFNSVFDLIDNDETVQAFAQMVEAEGGLMVMPIADPDAEAREDTPFPWWIVCGSGDIECDRPDDFVLSDEILRCVQEQELADPERLNTVGYSAGAVMTSHLVDRVDQYAGAVSMSGGIPPDYQPIVPRNATSVMAVHGGMFDMYCGFGVEECYDFVQPTEALAIGVDAAGNFAFVCDHQGGHGAALGVEAATFMRLAHTSGHPWDGQPFGGKEEPGLGIYCYGPGEDSPFGS